MTLGVAMVDERAREDADLAAANYERLAMVIESDPSRWQYLPYAANLRAAAKATRRSSMTRA